MKTFIFVDGDYENVMIKTLQCLKRFVFFSSSFFFFYGGP